MNLHYKVRLFAIALGAIGAEFIAVYVLCQTDGSLNCKGPNYGDLDQALGLVSFSLLLSILPLFFLKEPVYHAWFKFAAVALPVIALLIWITPATQSSGYALTFGPDRELVSWILAPLFLVVSYLLILIKAFRIRKQLKAGSRHAGPEMP
jgi:hypothetical protein